MRASETQCLMSIQVILQQQANEGEWSVDVRLLVATIATAAHDRHRVSPTRYSMLIGDASHIIASHSPAQ
jgi:hypothetical protein